MKKTLFAVLMALFVSDLAMASKANVKQDFLTGKNPHYNRQDGVYFDATNKGAVLVQNNWVDRPLSRLYYVDSFEDFLGAWNEWISGGTATETIINSSSPWAIKDTSSSGTPTHANQADAANGILDIILASTDEVETQTLFWNDELSLNAGYGPVMIMRMTVKEDIVTNDDLVFGFASAQNDTPDSTTYNAWFRLAATMDLLIESDNDTTNDDDNDTGVDLVEDTWYDFMIDCSDPTDCDFFYRASGYGSWTELLSTTAFAIGLTKTSAFAIQPYLQLSKDGAGTDSTVPGVSIDFIEVFQRRQ